MSTINSIHVAASPLMLPDPVHVANQITYTFDVYSLTCYHLCDLACKLLPLEFSSMSTYYKSAEPRHMHLNVFEAANNYRSTITAVSRYLRS